MGKIIKASLISGISLGLVAPITWPILIYLVEDRFPAWEAYRTATLSISFFAIFIGLIGSIVIGIPTLKWLDKHNANKPIIAGVIGFVITWIAFYLLSVNSEQTASTPFWIVINYFSLLGAFCGILASKLSSPSKTCNSGSTKDSAPDSLAP